MTPAGRIAVSTFGLLALGLAAGARPAVAGRSETYRMVFIAPSVASLTNFRARSQAKGAGGGPRWTASVAEVAAASSFPGIGYRVGGWRDRIGGDVEFSISAHHTTRQTAYYDAAGMIYHPPARAYVPVRLGAVALPDRFLMLHSLQFGGNLYARLPGRFVQPYAGIGGGLLVNAVQSQYAGPAALTRGTGKLPLDDLGLGWAVQVPVGIRAPWGDARFLFAEFRPSWRRFSYDSGSAGLEEHDAFILQVFEAQAGIGFLFR